jgi:hypothetical protein
MKLVLRFFISLTFFVFGGVLHAQTTWTGSINADWNTAGNWTFGVPLATDDVVIPDVTTDPVISTATALAFSIQVHNGAQLTITATGHLTINTTSDAIWNMGTVENNGIITIGNLSGSGSYGIDNESVFNNNAGAQINIDSTLMTAINNSGTMSNTGDITLGANNSPGAAGLQNTGTFYNNTGGHIRIDRTTGTAFINDGGDFTNSGNITIGAGYDCQSGLANLGTFNNVTGGQIAIDRAMGAGLLNYSGTFTNAGNIALGQIANDAYYLLVNMATFENVPGGEIDIDRAVNSAIAITAGTMNNEGSINIGSNFASGDNGIYNFGSFNNKAGGEINIDQIAATGIYHNGTDFTNAGTINIGALSAVSGFDLGIDSYTIFNNNTGGIINIDRVNDAITPNDNTFNNAGTVTIGALTNVPWLIAPGASGTFSNNIGGVFKGSGFIYTDNYVGAGGILSPGAPIGSMVFDADKDLTNNLLSIEIKGTGIPGTNFDAIEVQGTATIGGDLIISTPGFTMSPGQSFVILQATTAVTGTFASVTWPAGVTGIVTYGATTVTLNILTVLPLTLVDFSGNATGNKTVLQWKTADEVNTAAFDIERSANGINYTTIGSVKAIGQGANNYNKIDEEPVAGNNYYRLKMKDLDGKFTVSRVVVVKHATKAGLQLAPVPAIGYVTVQLKDQSLLNQRAQVYNSIGYLVTEVGLTNGARINMTGWPAGVYTLRTKTDSYQFVKQ